MISLLLPFALMLNQTDGKAALQAWQTKLKSAQTLTGSLVVDGGPFSDKVDFQLMKPNLGRSVSKSSERVSDGAISYDFNREDKTYFKMKSAGMPFVTTLFFGFEAFYGDEGDFEYKKETKEKVNGEDVTAVTLGLIPGRLLIVGFESNGGPPIGITGAGYTVKLYFKAKGEAPLGFELNMPDQVIKGAYRNIKLNEKLDIKSFAWVPPKGAKETKLDELDDVEAKLLPVGSKAPDFTLKTHDGKTIKLSEYVKDKKATLLNFWYWGCAGCLIEFPHLEKLNTSLKGKGLGLLTLNLLDDAATVKKYYAEGKFTLPCLLMKDAKVDIPKQYGVLAYPTNYIVDKNMKILYRATGEYLDDIKATLTKAGVK
ncbi:MAG: redoxin domain-containing protein [Fimbriimonadaceae bacterium]|nr:redoxin domain-containing protein [Fimbriimonadaceae bacterium]